MKSRKNSLLLDFEYYFSIGLSHIGILLSIFGYSTFAMLWLDRFGLYNILNLLLCIFFAVALTLIVGYIDERNKFLEKKNSRFNRRNLELMRAAKK